MINATHDQTFEQRLARLDLTPVLARVQAEHNLSSETITRADELYREFLRLLNTRGPGVSLVPPRIVDLVWDNHILFTKKYQADCELLFGQFIHHFPLEGATVSEGSELESTLAHFMPHPSYRALHGTDLAALADCGGNW